MPSCKPSYLPSCALPCSSVALQSLEGVPYLFASLGDGHVFNFKVNIAAALAHGAHGAAEAASASAAHVLLDRKSVLLGTQPVTLSVFENKVRLATCVSAARMCASPPPRATRPHATALLQGQTHIFAACDRPTILHSTSRKLVYSNVNQRNVTYMTAFHSSAFPESLALATESALSICTVDNIQKLHVQSIPLKEQPRRVVHHAQSRSILVAVESAVDEAVDPRDAHATGTVAVERSFIRCLDDTTFERVASFELDSHETPLSMFCATLRSGDPDKPALQFVLVGTAYMAHEEEEPSRGRILALEIVPSPVDGSRTFRIAGSVPNVKGGVFALHQLSDTALVAAVNNRVVVYGWTPSPGADASDTTYNMASVTRFSGNVLVLGLDVKNDFVLVADMMRSVSLLKYVPRITTPAAVAVHIACAHAVRVCLNRAFARMPLCVCIAGMTARVARCRSWPPSRTAIG
ncbi:hypothetical protein EON66_01770 [archaeon]|nr:MAG: hypothetical protein EON66_01770 [archaeon]